MDKKKNIMNMKSAFDICEEISIDDMMQAQGSGEISVEPVLFSSSVTDLPKLVDSNFSKEFMF